MPKRANRPCNAPSCAGYAVENGYCKKHQGKVKQKQKHYDKARGTAWAAGYDSDWQKARDLHLNGEPLCRHCDKRGYIVPATEVDHIIPFKGKDDPKRLEPSNFQSLCHSCHVTKTNEDKRTGLHKHSRATSRVPSAADLDIDFIAVGDKVVCITAAIQQRLICDDNKQWEVLAIDGNQFQVSDGDWSDWFHHSNFQKVSSQ